jgi:hypothetical protein
VSEDLIDWLRAQIDLDQQKAAAFSAGTWVRRGQREVYSLDGDAVAVGADRAEADFIADHDPARVLGEVKSWRTLLNIYEDACRYYAKHRMAPAGELHGLLTAIKLLAAGSFSGRPGFREEWRPQ